MDLMLRVLCIYALDTVHTVSISILYSYSSAAQDQSEEWAVQDQSEESAAQDQLIFWFCNWEDCTWTDDTD